MTDFSDLFSSTLGTALSAFVKPIITLAISLAIMSMILTPFIGGQKTIGEISHCINSSDYANAYEMHQCIQTKLNKAEAQFGVAKTVAEDIIFPYYGIKL